MTESEERDFDRYNEESGAADAAAGAEVEELGLSPDETPKGADVMWRTSGIYTGSAADYEKPSLMKVGTGAGLLYGWGLYGSSDRGVAELYSKIAKGSSRGIASANVYDQTWFTNRDKGDESHLLKWEEPVSDENKKRVDDRLFELSGNRMDWDDVKTGEDLYNKLANFASPKEASEFLASADIDGVKYSLADTYGGEVLKNHQGEFNYVSFRDDNITVDHKWSDGKMMWRTATEDEQTRLDGEKTIKLYRAMQLIDGKLYPPMAAKVDGKFVDGIPVGDDMSIEKPFWQVADEPTAERIEEMIKNNQIVVDEDGKLSFKLDKGNGKSIFAAYNPYWHMSNRMLNDQFDSVYQRPNIVVVEVEAPVSEDGAYWADRAKNMTGWTGWHSGPVATWLEAADMDKGRNVFLSRYCKVLRVVPNADVAESIRDLLDGTNIQIPTNVVTPSLRAELEKLGVPMFDTIDENGGFDKSAYTRMKNVEVKKLTKAYSKEEKKSRKARKEQEKAEIARKQDALKGSAADVKWRTVDEDVDPSKENAEFQEIWNRYHDADGKPKKGWMLAPNGKATKLTARQWVQVRTPEFKKWFGDWHDLLCQKFLDGESLAQASGKEYAGEGRKEITNGVYENWGRVNYVVTNPGIGEISLSKSGIHDSMAHGIGRAKIATLNLVPEILSKGMIVRFRKNWENRGYDSYIIAAPISIGDVRHAAFAIVNSNEGGNRFYLHEVGVIDDIKKKAEAFRTGSSGEMPALSRNLGDIQSIALEIFSVNPESVSKVVDENGEPLVVYHSGTVGTNVKRFVYGRDGKMTELPKFVFTEDSHFGTEQAAADRAKQRGDKESNTLSVFLDIKNPKVVDDYDAQSAVYDPYDGFMYENWREDPGSTSWVAHNPAQIKSATDNNGDFSSANPDILWRTYTPDPGLRSMADALGLSTEELDVLMGGSSFIAGRTLRQTMFPTEAALVGAISDEGGAKGVLKSARNLMSELSSPGAKGKWNALLDGLRRRLTDYMLPVLCMEQWIGAKSGNAVGVSESFVSFVVLTS